MSDFPMGYEFYDHHKGPPGNPRHDVYLYGNVLSGYISTLNQRYNPRSGEHQKTLALSFRTGISPSRAMAL